MKARHFVRDEIRARIATQGAGALSDLELLAMFMRARGQIAAQERARGLLERFGGLREIITADRAELAAAGLDDRGADLLAGAVELARRHHWANVMRGSAVGNPRLVREYLRAKLRDLEHEIFGCLYLDNRHRVIAWEELFRGTIDGASIHPREVVKSCLKRNAAAVIICHNHPSGVAEPSQADELITRRLKEALGLIDVRLIDHLIVGDTVIESMAERGLV